VQRWQSTVEATARPALRLGEIYFLQHDYDGAASAFGTAAQRARLVHWNDDLSVDQADLDRRAALLAAGRSDEGVAVLRPLVAAGTTGFAQQNATANGYDEGAVSFAAVAYFASEPLADHERETGALHAAIDDYTSALAWMAPDETQPEPDENGPEVAPQSPAVLESAPPYVRKCSTTMKRWPISDSARPPWPPRRWARHCLPIRPIPRS
jgi:hypothetical protein